MEEEISMFYKPRQGYGARGRENGAEQVSEATQIPSISLSARGC